MDRKDIFKFVRETYGDEPEYPWLQFPAYAVFRHAGSGKWYALVMTVPKRKLGFAADTPVEILNVKCDPRCIGSMLDGERFFPAYHMNREHWVSILLDGFSPEEEVYRLIGLSYALTEAR